MARMLVSWIAFNNDFENNQVNTQGPTFSFHQHFFEGYQKHLLLTAEKETGEITKGLLLSSALKKEFPQHEIQLRHLNLPGKDIVNFNRIYAEVFALLHGTEDEVDLFVSPGTPTMQVVWHHAHQKMGLKTRLLQTLRSEHSSTGKPELQEIKMDQAPHAEFLLMQETNLDSKTSINSNYFITDSLKPIYGLAGQIALTDKTTVLIQGETGTGKEHLAHYIHDNSKRKNEPFIAVNCAAISPDLLESRLFGYEKGAFTSALKATSGYFQAANKGTIFLDEIGDINSHMQVALLRILQQGEFQKVGSTATEKVDIRVIAATNKDLYQECKKGNFRWDLYYRLCVAEVTLPPLVQRGTKEIKALLEYFSNRLSKDLQFKNRKVIFTDQSMTLLSQHGWPGNIRELQNFVERCYAYGKQTITPDLLSNGLLKTNEESSIRLEDVVRSHVRKVVNQFNGNLSRSKEVLGLGSINTLKKHLNDGERFRQKA